MSFVNKVKDRYEIVAEEDQLKEFFSNLIGVLDDFISNLEDLLAVRHKVAGKVISYLARTLPTELKAFREHMKSYHTILQEISTVEDAAKYLETYLIVAEELKRKLDKIKDLAHKLKAEMVNDKESITTSMSKADLNTIDLLVTLDQTDVLDLLEKASLLGL